MKQESSRLNLGNFFGLSSTRDNTCTACPRTRRLAEARRFKSSEMPRCSTSSTHASWFQRTHSHRASRQSAWMERLGFWRSMSSSTSTAPWSESKEASVEASAAMAGAASLRILSKLEIVLLLTSCSADSCTSFELRTIPRGTRCLLACSLSSIPLNGAGLAFSSSLSVMSPARASLSPAAQAASGAMLIGTPYKRRSFSRSVAILAETRACAPACAAKAPNCFCETRRFGPSPEGRMEETAAGGAGGLTYPRARSVDSLHDSAFESD